ncbi:hypothetical protein QBC47DRAFT_358726 [Echria macrotheca]|uniref:Uncharacterized protein n=1 Tax=Echria macrotheca TaxID=438768 RepID=A0AAJ0FBL5_9PEZI|nr:hypothetical protein QBC47DRAFT_358726 [Echria macrotheca]
MLVVYRGGRVSEQSPPWITPRPGSSVPGPEAGFSPESSDWTEGVAMLSDVVAAVRPARLPVGPIRCSRRLAAGGRVWRAGRLILSFKGPLCHQWFTRRDSISTPPSHMGMLRLFGYGTRVDGAGGYDWPGTRQPHLSETSAIHMASVLTIASQAKGSSTITAADKRSRFQGRERTLVMGHVQSWPRKRPICGPTKIWGYALPGSRVAM